MVDHDFHNTMETKFKSEATKHIYFAWVVAIVFVESLKNRQCKKDTSTTRYTFTYLSHVTAGHYYPKDMVIM